VPYDDFAHVSESASELELMVIDVLAVARQPRNDNGMDAQSKGLEDAPGTAVDEHE
jgi:hypothetical protein